MPYFTLILSLIQPLIALPFAFVEIIKKSSKHLPVFCIALAFAIITFTLEPFETLDLYRHYQRIVSLRGLPLITIIQNASFGYLVFDIYAWVINSLHLPKEAFPSSIVFLSYYLILWVFVDIKITYRNYLDSLIILIIFLIFWLSIGYIGLNSGIRNPLANIIVFYVSYKLFFYKKLLLFLLGSLLAFFIHPFAAVPALAVYISYKIPSASKSAKIFIYLGMVFTLSTKLITFGLDKILAYISYLSFYDAAYFDLESNVGGSAYQGITTNEFIALVVLPKIPIYLGYLYLLFIKPKTNNSLYLLLSLLCLYLGFFSSFGTVYNRMAAFFLFVFALFISQEAIIKKSKAFRIFISIYALSLVASSIMSIYTFRLYLITAFPEIIKPLLFILFHI